MRKLDKAIFGIAAAAAAILVSAPAMAGSIPLPALPAPGVMGLVAGGVIAAIAVARLRR